MSADAKRPTRPAPMTREPLGLDCADCGSPHARFGSFDLKRVLCAACKGEERRAP